MGHTISIGQLRQNPTAMIRDVKQGATYTLTDRGQPVADIAPHRPERWRMGREASAVLSQLGADLLWMKEARRLRADDELRDPVPNFDAEVGLGKVGKNNAHLATVIGVDYACHGVDAMLSGESRARSYTAVCMLGLVLKLS